MRSELKEDMSTLSQALLLEAYLLAAPEHLKVETMKSINVFCVLGPQETATVPQHPQIHQRHNISERTNQRCVFIREEEGGDYF